jgi:hypothetical protein
LDGIKKALQYTFRVGSLKKVREVESNPSLTAVVFLHGVFSSNESAFKRSTGDGYFWDDICDYSSFSSFDFFYFNYGVVDVSRLKELASPFNSLNKLAAELHGNVKQYTNLIIIAHSQGGLLGKAYCSAYYKEQGIYLVTLSTPNHNKSQFVMRLQPDWEKKVKYYVSHLSCGSINDNWVVKPGEATAYGKCDVYISTTKFKKGPAGHSHLSQAPDAELLNRLTVDTGFFINSGLNKHIYHSYFNIPFGASDIVIKYSRSRSKLNRYRYRERDDCFENREALIVKGWPDFRDEVSTKFLESKDRKVIYCHGSSVSFFVRVLFNCLDGNTDRYQVQNIDAIEHDNSENTNDRLCDECLPPEEHADVGDNPYKNIAFFTSDFIGKPLVNNEDFFIIFISRIRERGIKNDDEERLFLAYEECALLFLVKRLRAVYQGCLISNGISWTTFSFDLLKILDNLIAFEKKQNIRVVSFLALHKALKRNFSKHRTGMPLRDMEYVVSCLFSSKDCHFYGLDRDIRESLLLRQKDNNRSRHS